MLLTFNSDCFGEEIGETKYEKSNNQYLKTISF